MVKKNLPLLSIAFLTIIYFIFPTANSTIDGYTYGYSIKWGIELFYPHHLLYNYSYFFVFKALQFVSINTDALTLAKYLNSLAAGSTLLVLHQIFLLKNLPPFRAAILLFFSGSSYGIMRYATENETYILPILLSIIGFYYFIKCEITPTYKYIFLCSLFSSIACLYHQIHFFWWLGILISVIIYVNRINYSRPFIIIYLLTAWLVPLVYLLVLIDQVNTSISFISYFKFVFHDFFNGSVEFTFGFNNISLGIINFIRTFYQIHGRIWYLIKGNPSLIIIVLIVSALTYNVIIPLNKIKIYPYPKISKLTLLIIGSLNFGFAIYSVGNAEFMVMLPVILCLLITYTNFSSYKIALLSTSMFLWNLFFGLLPDSKINYSNTDFIIKYISNHQNIDFILSNSVLIKNIFYYNNQYYPINIPYTPKLGLNKLKEVITASLKKNRIICTDMIYNKDPISRGSILGNNKTSFILKQYQVSFLDSFDTFYGKRRLYRINDKDKL